MSAKPKLTEHGSLRHLHSLYKQGAHGEVQGQSNRALQLWPNSAKLHHLIALSARRQGDDKKACFHLKKRQIWNQPAGSRRVIWA